jgi:hypothetical protein
MVFEIVNYMICSSYFAHGRYPKKETKVYTFKNHLIKGYLQQANKIEFEAAILKPFPS